MIDTAVFAGHHSPLTRTRPADDSRRIADTSIGNQGAVGSVSSANHFTLIIVQGHARLDVVASQTHATVTDAMVDDDAACRWQNSRYTVIADAIGTGPAYRMGNLTGYGDYDQFLAVDTESAVRHIYQPL